MAAVTEGLIGSGFTGTEIHGFCFAGFVLQRGKSAVFMLAVAKGLILAFATGAPVISFSLLYSNGYGGIASADRVGHGGLHYQ